MGKGNGFVTGGGGGGEGKLVCNRGRGVGQGKWVCNRGWRGGGREMGV